MASSLFPFLVVWRDKRANTAEKVKKEEGAQDRRWKEGAHKVMTMDPSFAVLPSLFSLISKDAGGKSNAVLCGMVSD